MVEVLVIPDGAAHLVRPGAMVAHMPALEALAAEGGAARVRATPPGLPPGSETCIPTLLGHPPSGPVGRGRIDAAAYGVRVPDGLIPWRADALRPDGTRASAQEAAGVARRLAIPAVATRGHRLLLLAASKPADRRGLRVWSDGPAPRGILDPPTTIVCGPGAAAGCGRLLGAHVSIPAGATGDVDTDLGAKARAATAAIAEGWPRVVVHVGAPDEAAHRRDADAVIRALERIDAELLVPLADAVQAAGGRLAVCPDHGTDPLTGRHDDAPVPAVRWGAGIERASADVVDPDWLFESRAARA